TATITYSVTIADPPGGDHKLGNTAVVESGGSNCPADSTDPACGDPNGPVIPTLTVKKAADPAAPVPGDKVTWTVTLANDSAADYKGASFSDDLGDVVDDAAYGNDATATSGTVSYQAPTLTWTGDVPKGQTVTVTYSATVGNPPEGNHKLGNQVVA